MVLALPLPSVVQTEETVTLPEAVLVSVLFTDTSSGDWACGLPSPIAVAAWVLSAAELFWGTACGLPTMGAGAEGLLSGMPTGVGLSAAALVMPVVNSSVHRTSIVVMRRYAFISFSLFCDAKFVTNLDNLSAVA